MNARTKKLLANWTILILLLCVCYQKGYGQIKQDKRRPNIIFIMSDDQSYKTISAYDSTLIHTPNIDRLAKEGLRFTNANVTNSLCAPTRAVLLTGKYGFINGVRNNRNVFNENQMTWVKQLQKHGYYTSIIGKWHLKSLPKGFDDWDISIGLGHYYNPWMIENGDTMQVTGYSPNIIFDNALKILKNRNKSKPFAMLIHTKAPHRPWMPDSAHMNLFDNRNIPLPETFFDNYSTRSAAAREAHMLVQNLFLSHDLKVQPKYFDRETGSGGAPEGYDAIAHWEQIYNRLTPHQKKTWDAHYDSVGHSFKERQLSGISLAYWKYQRFMKDYLRCIAAVDDNVGRVLRYLDKARLNKNTIVVYTTDQGAFIGEHGWIDKRFMYEPSMRIPLLVRYPKEIKAGRTSDKLVMNLDFAPTFLDEAGIKVPDNIQGRSLRPIFGGQATDKNWRQAAYYHFSFFPKSWHDVKRHYGIKTKRWKLIHFYFDIDAWELYDLKNDPEEVNNLYQIPSYKPVADSLRGKLKQLQVQYGDTTFDESPGMFQQYYQGN